MPEYLAPGVYVEEISTRSKPIEGVGTSTAGFVGPTERGPHYPVLIGSQLEFERWFGDLLPVSQAYLPFAIHGFFQNGGQRCFVSRVTASNATIAQLQVGGLLNVAAIGKGAWGSRVRIKVTPSDQSSDDNLRFNVTLIYYRIDRDPGDDFADPFTSENLTRADLQPDAVEQFEDLTHREGDSKNVLKVINANSKLVRCWWEDPANIATILQAAFVPLEGGTDGDGTPDADAYSGSSDDPNLGPILGQDPPLDAPLGRGSGLLAIENVDEVAILIVPDAVRNGLENVTETALQQCERLKDRFAIVSTQSGLTNVQQVNKFRDTLYGAIYYPWIQVFDPIANKPQMIPPSGHVAGVYARTDVERGVHKAPANAVVRGAQNLEFNVTKTMQDILNPKNVNCLRDFRPDGRGIRVWGARTMSSDPEWKYVNVRRLFIFIEESIEEGTQWLVFEPNFEPTWAKVVRSITNFLVTIWKNGALEGLTQDEAFFVKCDRTTMTQDDIDNGRLICYIGVAPVKPAEFVIFRISQKTREATS